MVHTGRMLDRHMATGKMILRVQQDSGRVLDVRVDERDYDEAGRVWGNSYVSFTFRGGKAFFSSHGAA